MSLMPTYDALGDDMQRIVYEMANAARRVMNVAGCPPMNDDRAAVFDEACAVFLNEALVAQGAPGAVPRWWSRRA